MYDEPLNPDQPEEPSVLDYVKSLFRFGRGERIAIPSIVEETREPQPDSPAHVQPSNLEPEKVQPISLQPIKPIWRSLLVLFLALLGQRMFEPPRTNTGSGIALYIAALGILVWTFIKDEWGLPPPSPTWERTDPQTYHRFALILAVLLAFASFALFTDNLFTAFNVALWILAILTFIGAFWLRDANTPSLWRRLKTFFAHDTWQINISRWTLLILAVTALSLFFRFYHTPNIPPEPISDHAEKIFDVYDVTQGRTLIFFPRNTGREGFQMYWTVLISWVFGTGLSFLSLKLGTAILGVLTLPYIYFLGREIGGARVGLFALLFAGMGYWPNVISRVGLRFPLYPLFVAPTLLYLIRGLRTRNRNDFLLSGLFLGLGLHGYSPFRILPFVVVTAFGLYWLHSQSKGARRELIPWLTLLGLTALIVFLPLLRYWIDDPGVFGFRAFSRLTGSENTITEPIGKIFLSNLWNALRMFNYDDGEIWVHSVTHRPALDTVSAALFLFGVVLVLVRYLRSRHWLDIFLLASIPLLQMPSILSLSFPGENPALNRAGGALVPAFVVVAMALDGLLTGWGTEKRRILLGWVVTGSLVFASASQNFDLVFRQYVQEFRGNSWNTSEMGAVIKQFGQTYGTTDTAWVVPFPHWVDTRLPGVWAGIPNRDFAMWREDLPSTVQLPGPKLFIVKANVEDHPETNDQQSLDVLEQLYPNGQLSLHKSDIVGHDFWIFFVPNRDVIVSAAKQPPSLQMGIASQGPQ